MPGYDKTGPSGRGPMTGGGFGRCGGSRGFSREGVNFGGGRSGRPFGGGRGRVCRGGRGGWWGFNRNQAPDWIDRSETEDLRAAAEDLKAQLKAVEERLANIEKEQL